MILNILNNLFKKIIFYRSRGNHFLTKIHYFLELNGFLLLAIQFQNCLNLFSFDKQIPSQFYSISHFFDSFLQLVYVFSLNSDNPLFSSLNLPSADC